MKVSCDGGNPVLGHPQLYLQIPANSDGVTCPYCGKQFVLEKTASDIAA